MNPLHLGIAAQGPQSVVKRRLTGRIHIPECADNEQTAAGSFLDQKLQQ